MAGNDATVAINKERFSDEINEGVLIHAKSITPNEAIARAARCRYKTTMCAVGYECPDELLFNDKTHQDGFIYGDNQYCNCWINRQAEDIWIPKLEAALKLLHMK